MSSFNGMVGLSGDQKIINSNEATWFNALPDHLTAYPQHCPPKIWMIAKGSDQGNNTPAIYHQASYAMAASFIGKLSTLDKYLRVSYNLNITVAQMIIV